MKQMDREIWWIIVVRKFAVKWCVSDVPSYTADLQYVLQMDFTRQFNGIWIIRNGGKQLFPENIKSIMQGCTGINNHLQIVCRHQQMTGGLFDFIGALNFSVFSLPRYSGDEALMQTEKWRPQRQGFVPDKPVVFLWAEEIRTDRDRFP